MKNQKLKHKASNTIMQALLKLGNNLDDILPEGCGMIVSDEAYKNSVRESIIAMSKDKRFMRDLQTGLEGLTPGQIELILGYCDPENVQAFCKLQMNLMPHYVRHAVAAFQDLFNETSENTRPRRTKKTVRPKKPSLSWSAGNSASSVKKSTLKQ